MIKDDEITKEFLENILESMEGGIFTVDKNARITSFNRAAEEITGFKRGEVLNKECCDILKSDLCQKACPLKETLETGKTFFVPRLDLEKLNIGDVFRLKDLFNVKIKEKTETVHAEYAGEELIPESAKIQWTTTNYVKMNVLVPHLLFENDKYNSNSLEEVEGFAEEAVTKIKTGDIVQFERFGFVRIENLDDGIIGFFSHN